MYDLECGGAALRLIDPMPESHLATGDSATVALRHEARPPLWFVPALSMLPVSTRRCLVRNPLNGAAMELSSGEYAVLAACEGCHPLAEHEARAALQLSAPAEHRPAFREFLERCARVGMLVQLPDLVARFGRPHASPPPPQPDIVIRSADRPQLLQRLLQGAVTLQARTGHAYRWHVVDDSRREESRRANCAAIARYGSLGAAYHDLSLPESLEADLCRELPQLAAEIRLLLAAPREGELTFGRPINYLLLRFAGRRVLMLDDDVMIDPRRPAQSRRGVEVSVAPEEACWYENADAALDACPALELDPFTEHARWLGLPLAQAWAQAEREPGGLHVGDLPPPCGTAFAADARILFTRNHVLGDPGWAKFASPLLVLAPQTRHWLAAHPEAAQCAFASPVHWRGRLGLRVAPHQTLSTTTLTGFDNSVLLPPTERCTREADVLLGEAARCVYPAAWQAELPFALPHLRDAPRQWLRPDETLTLGASVLLITHARAVLPAIRAEGGVERMRALGACLLDLAAADDGKLRDLLEEQAIEYVGRIRFSVQEQLTDSSLPGAWHELLQRWRQAPAFKLDRASLQASIVAPEQVRTEAQHYGRTLGAWPQIWSHCRERFA
jgi:hypothetical protein